MKEHLLVVDDDHEIRTLLGDFLTKHNYIVDVAKDGDELFTVWKKNPTIRLIILDIMMPGMDGFEICKKIRLESDVYIIMLTAVDEPSDRVIGLEFGADDYLAKPFNSRELLARIKSVLRRTRNAAPIANAHNSTEEKLPIWCFAGWKLDTSVRQLISPEGLDISLNSGIYDLLLALIERPQRVLSRDQLLNATHNRDAGPFDRSIDVQISRLRQKLEEDPKNPKLIKTVRTGGYLFTPEVTKQ